MTNIDCVEDRIWKDDITRSKFEHPPHMTTHNTLKNQ